MAKKNIISEKYVIMALFVRTLNLYKVRRSGRSRRYFISRPSRRNTSTI
jgi:hypothetical protein